MAITQVSEYAVGNTDFTAMMESLDKAFKGKAEITLSNYDNDSEPVVKTGSVFESGGALFVVDTADITPTGYSGIANSTTFYLYYDDSAGAFIYSSTAPTWDDAKQGWYNGLDRALFSMYKDSGGTLYEAKTLLKSQSLDRIENLTLSGDMQWKYYYKNTASPTENTFFDAVKDWIPNSGDAIALHGHAVGGQITTIGASITGMYRNDVAVIVLSFIANNGTTGQITVNDGVGTILATSIVLMANFDSIT